MKKRNENKPLNKLIMKMSKNGELDVYIMRIGKEPTSPEKDKIHKWNNLVKKDINQVK